MGGKSKEQYKNDVLLDLFYIAESTCKDKIKKVNKKGFSRIHQNYSEKKNNVLSELIKIGEKECNYIFDSEQWKKIDNDINLIRQCYYDAFENMCKTQANYIEKLSESSYSKDIIENHTIRCILETASYYYGMPRYEGRETRYRYITKTIYDETISRGKKISDFSGPIHYEHVIPMNELIKLLKDESQDFETFDKTMKEKMFVCCVSDKDNKKLNKNSMPKEKKEEWKKQNANINDVWARYVTKSIQVYDLYKGKTILTIK